MKTAALLLMLIVLLAGATTPAVAHSPTAAEAASSHEMESTAAPLKGAADLTRALLEGGWGQLGEQPMATLSKMHQAYGAADEAEREGGAAKAARIRAGLDHNLEHFLEALPLTLTVDLNSGAAKMSGDHRFNFSGDTGVILLRLDAGPARGGCEVIDLDMENFRETEPYRMVRYVPGATTWVLMNAQRAPAGTHVTYLNFQNDVPSELRLGSITTVVPEPGYLSLNILDGDTSTTTPALVRFRHRDNGSGYRPSNAIDVSAQMHNIAGSMSVGASRPDILKVPNKFRGHFWCVPGSFNMSFPPGTWDIDLYKGVEYQNISSSITVNPGERTEVTFRMERWIDMRTRGWWSGDDHVHARLMSDDDAERLLVLAEAADISVSNILRMGNSLRTFYEQRGFGPDFRVIRNQRALVPGQEDPRFFFGHSIGLNLRRGVREAEHYGLNDSIAAEIHRQGGLYGHAHVAADLFTISSDMTMMVPFGQSDFGEVLQADMLGTATWYTFLNLGYPLTATAGSDMPYHATIGEVRFYVYTGKPELDVDAWFAALRAGHTFVSNGPMLDFRIGGEFRPGDTIRRAADGTLTARVVAEGQPGMSAPKSLRLIRFGKTIGEATNDDPQQGRLELAVRIPIGYGGWIAAHATGHDGSQAHTTPIYIVREGFRPWDADNAAALIEERLNRIGVIEADLTHLENQKKAGAMWELNDFNNKLFAVMPRNRERLAAARAHYEGLKTVLADEAKRR